MKIFKALSCLCLAACAAPNSDYAERRDHAQPTALSLLAPPAASLQPQPRSNATIAADFLALTFQMESGRKVERFTRFEGPITYRITGAAPPQTQAQIAHLTRRIGTQARIPLRAAPANAPASITIDYQPRSVLRAAVPQAACFVAPNVSTWAEFIQSRGTGRLDWTRLTTRERVAIFIPAEATEQEARDCLNEELGQALGPLNDMYHLSDSVFNDDNFISELTAFDMLLLRLTHATEFRSGMTRPEVEAALPRALARLNPGGGAVGRLYETPVSRDWNTLIEAAISPTFSKSTRRRSAERALALAEAAGWHDNRRGFSHFVLARLEGPEKLEAALYHFTRAAEVYRRLPEAALHIAHVDMQMAAFALASGDHALALKLSQRALPPAKAAHNGAVVAMLKFTRASALDATGDSAAAAATRLDSQPWARYGFGSDAEIRARMSEVAALARGGRLGR